MGTWEEGTTMRAESVSGIVIAAAIVLVLLAAVFFATFAALPVEPDVIPIRWNGELAA